MSLEAKIIHAATNGDMATVRECLKAMHPQDWSRILSACEWIRDEDLKMRWETEREDETTALLMVTAIVSVSGGEVLVRPADLQAADSATLTRHNEPDGSVRFTTSPRTPAEPIEPLNLPWLKHHHETDAGGNCRDPQCGYNSDVAAFAEGAS